MSTFNIDFIGIGVEKAATYWVADCLKEHPDVCFAKQKELAFFNEYDQHFLEVKNPRYQRGLEWYSSFFEDCTDDRLKGEYTPTYLYSSKAADRIKKHFPDVKLICTLRNPIKRAFSQYLHDKSIGIIPDISFEEAIETYDAYLEKGKYAKHLRKWIKLFGKENIHFIVTDDIKKRPVTEVKKLYAFLGIDSTFRPESLYKNPNPASIARFPWLNRFLMRSEYQMMSDSYAWIHKILEDLGIRRMVFWASYYINRKPLGDNYPKMEPKTERKLHNYYKRDSAQLRKLTGITV